MQNKKIGKYTVQNRLGKGSFGQVFLGNYNGEKVAIKCIQKDRNSKKQIRDLKLQAEILTKIKHQNIVNLKQSFQTQTQLYVIMQFGGIDISRLLERQRKFSEDKIKLLGKQIASAMLYLKDNKIMHRDLKPQNILLQGQCIKICDFGFAKKLSASTNFLLSIKGTPLYISPQIILKQKYTYKADVWSMGIILYQMAVGKTPFYAHTIHELQPKIINDQVRIPAHISLQLRELIDGMLQKSQVKRLSWEEVLNHRFFKTQSSNVSHYPVSHNEQLEVQPQVKWIPEEQCAYFKKVQTQFIQGKIQLSELKYNVDFCLRLIRLLGQVCIDRNKIPKDVVFGTLRLVVKLAMQKHDPKQTRLDLAKNNDLMTAIAVLAQQEKDQQILATLLELIGFLLKQNFDGLTIDTDHDEQITNIVSKIITQRPCLPTTALSLKVLGILTSQALATIEQSQQYFRRIYEDKIVSQVAECYGNIAENNIVLECLEKFMHPRLERVGKIYYRTKKLFLQLKMQAAEILLKNKFLEGQPLLSRKWNRPGDLQIYCSLLFECVWVSQNFRSEFVKIAHLRQLLGKRQTRLYYLGCVYFVLKYTGVFMLTNEVIQNEIVQEGSENKLLNVFLIYFAHYTFSKHNASRTKNQKVKSLISNVKNILRIDLPLKIKYSKELLGFFAEESQFFDDILIEVLVNVLKDCKDEELITFSRPIIQETLLLPVSQDSLVSLLHHSEKYNIVSNSITKKLDQYFWENVRKGLFDDYLIISPKNCSQLLRKLLQVQCSRITDDNSFAKTFDELQLSKLFFNEALDNPQLVLYSLRIINKIFNKIRIFEHLSQGSLNSIKKYYGSSNEDLIVQIFTFCSSLARIKSDYCRQVLQSGIVPFCALSIDKGSQLEKQRALHVIGNLSKHNNEAFAIFDSYKIIGLLAKCVFQHKNNRKILKNTIFAIGNISFYTQRYAGQMKPILRCLPDALTNEDEHLLLNTLSTISNLLRHGPAHIQALIEYGVLSKVLALYSQTNKLDQINFCHNLFKKAIVFPQFLRAFGKENLRKAIESHIEKKIIDEKDDNVCNLKRYLIQA